MPAPRSADFVPAVEESSSASVRSSPRGSCGRSSASASRFRSAPGCRRRRRGRISSTDQAPLRVGVGRVDADGQTVLAAIRFRLLPPEREQRTDDAVLARRPDPLAVAGRDEPVQDRLDLIRGRVARRPQPMALRERVAELAKICLRRGLVAVCCLASARLRRMCSRQKRASPSDSSPRRPWFTWTAETR